MHFSLSLSADLIIILPPPLSLFLSLCNIEGLIGYLLPMREEIRMSVDDQVASSPSSRSRPLPDQVLENVLEIILSFLTSRRDRNSASLVCKSWYRTESLTRNELFIGNCYAVSPQRTVERFTRVKSIVLKGKPRFADFSLVPQDWGANFSLWISVVCVSYPWLEKICLKRMYVDNDDLFLIAHNLSNFKEIVLICCDGFGTSGLAVLVNKCRCLRVLDLIENLVSDDEVDWLSSFPTTTTCLESLSFECVEASINFHALESLVSRSPFLKKLRLNRYVSISQLQRLMLRAPQLTHLGTGSFTVDSDQSEEELDLFSSFSNCKDLTCLSGFSDITPDYLPSIYPVCANLTSLNLSYANVDNDQLKSVIVHCHKLQNLWVLDSICDDGLQAVADTCKDLLKLHVFPINAREDGDCPVSEIGLVAISEGCRKLRSILYFCQRMTNAAIVTMSKNCQDLLVFRLCIMGRHLPDHLTQEPMDEGFRAIVMNCKKLTRLAISGLLTDKAFEYIGEYGKQVRTLSVAFAGDSDTGLIHILRGCAKLQKLEIRDSPFGDEALLSGLHHYYNMRFVWMSSCRLTVAGCTELARRMPRLVVEAIRDNFEENNNDSVVEKFYIYRSLAGPRTDLPPFVTIL